MAMNVPASPGNTSGRIELIIRCVSDVLDLAAQIVAYPNVSKRTWRRGNIRRWSSQAPRRAGRGYNQRNGRAHRQFRCHTCSEGFHF